MQYITIDFDNANRKLEEDDTRTSLPLRPLLIPIAISTSKHTQKFGHWKEELNINNLAREGPQWWIVRVSRIKGQETAQLIARLLARNYPHMDFKVFYFYWPKWMHWFYGYVFCISNVNVFGFSGICAVDTGEEEIEEWYILG